VEGHRSAGASKRIGVEAPETSIGICIVLPSSVDTLSGIVSLWERPLESRQRS